eukprot:COSAG05_NODE_1632_length_4371_cov_247.693820_3_plen_167_part_00
MLVLAQGIAERKGVGHIVLGALPPPPAAAAAVASSSGAGWRCEEESCKWVGFHKDPRSWQKVIGTHTWFFIHSVAAKYRPRHPVSIAIRQPVSIIIYRSNETCSHVKALLPAPAADTGGSGVNCYGVFRYPEHPTAADQKAIVDFVGFLGQLYLCFFTIVLATSLN